MRTNVSPHILVFLAAKAWQSSLQGNDILCAPILLQDQILKQKFVELQDQILKQKFVEYIYIYI